MRNKVAVVTGAASGLGLAMCRHFAAEGMRIVMADLPGAALTREAGELAGAGAQVIAVPTDVRRFEDLVTLESRAATQFGGTDVLCNNAGVQAAGVAWEISAEDWQWVLEVNLWGQINGVRAFLPGMVRRGTPGHVVNTASMAGHLAYMNRGPYTVSKFGVVGLSEMLIQDIRNAGAPIGVSVLCPGFVTTNLHANSNRLRPSGGSSAPVTGSLADGMSADKVAGMVAEAILNDRFWILTHPGYGELVEKRARGIIATDEIVPGV